MRFAPPKKQKGHATGPRRLNGALLDVATMAAKLGTTEKKLRGDVERGLIPFRRLGGRIVFLDEEVMNFFSRLPGVSVFEALANHAVRRSSAPHGMKDDIAEA